MVHAPGENDEVQRQIHDHYGNRQTDGFPKALEEDRAERGKKDQRNQHRLVHPPGRQWILDDVRGVILLSLNQPANDGDDSGGAGMAELIEDKRAVNVLDQIEKDELKDVLVDVLSGLTEQEKLVLALYYYEEMTLKEIGETLDISESRASQIHTKAVGRVRRRLGKMAA